MIAASSARLATLRYAGWLVASLAYCACSRTKSPEPTAAPEPAAVATSTAQTHGPVVHTSAPPAATGAAGRKTVRPPTAAMRDAPLRNPFAYIPPQCYTRTHDEHGHVVNPCYVCHTAGPQLDDSDLQQVLKFTSAGAVTNRWKNLFSPAIERAAPIADDALLAYVRASNYLDSAGEITLAKKLAELPAEWDGEGDAKWGGFGPDAYYRFDSDGYDLKPDGARSGWRAVAYYPLPGTFFPSNGSVGDVLIRLDPMLRTRTADGPEDPEITRVNFAIVEALITERDVAIEEVDEATVGVDLDLDGSLGRTERVRFDRDGAGKGAGRMHYVGRAHELELSGKFPIARRLFPLNTEFLHSVRYLDVGESGRVQLAARMKELRYAKKVRWFREDELRARAEAEVIEQVESPNGARIVLWQHDRGVYNGQGWLLQAFIEDAGGELRPQTYEESAFCVGCHGGVGANIDSTFSFARKLREPAHGYFHWTQHDLRGIAEPRDHSGTFEYEQYLSQNRAGDELRDNIEILNRFFDDRGALRPDRVRALRADIGTLLYPSAARALALDRAYRALVLEQSFTNGRDAVLAKSAHVFDVAPLGAATGVTKPVGAKLTTPSAGLAKR